MHLIIQETAVLRPFKPPFDHDHLLSLSHIDTDRNLLVTLRYLRVYSNTLHQQADPFRVISAALSAALFHYYPFAGTLKRRLPDGRLELHCRVGDGVPVVSAVVNSPLSSVNYLDDVGVERSSPSSCCGGFVLGAAVHHAICDGLGATLFFNAMAELARGSDQMTVDPIWERSTLLGPRNPPRVEFPIHEFLSLDKDFFPYEGSGKRVIKDCFSVKEDGWIS
ncbi:UNVERIFIED_CONTAM: Spermidine coumaroyl-CoA acyltransferase [Sesamum radiatum]|uniref:Spermidine coumaroyl-CoA acyltransferase n=1 Tax=Sesamum radiatum TaxID=300843 RepID=A0AAW2UK68_SESRA